MIVFMLLLFLMMSKFQHKESLFLKHILIFINFKLNILGLVMDGHFHIFFFFEILMIDQMSNVEDESEYNFGDENRQFALYELPMFLVKYF